jgi:hypothetical protein
MPAVVSTNLPSFNSNPIDNAVTGWITKSDAKILKHLSDKNYALAEYIDSDTQLLKSETVYLRTLDAYRNLPNELEHEHQVRQTIWNEELRHVQHIGEMSELGRRTDVTRAEDVLEDARQKLTATRRYGSATYKIEHKKRQHELLDLALEEAEKRKLLSGEQYGDGEAEDYDRLDALYAARDELNARSLDTEAVQAAIDRLEEKE